MLRRQFNLGTASILATAAFLPGRALAQEQDELIGVMREWIAGNAEWISVESEPGKGSRILAPSDQRVIDAAKYLIGLPKDKAPVELAKIMMKDPTYGGVWEWPSENNMSPANPLIVAFFAATSTKPEGDVTPWCAAFMGWVLRRCNYPSSGSAASASYRDFDKFPVALGDQKHPAAADTVPEKTGDIIVFRDVGDTAHGHVAFFDGWADDEKTVAWCVGGNQHDQLSRQQFRLYAGPKRLVAIRRPTK
ncbi:CHAP domain-containing protein [Rhizobium sp. CB3090]|uniref:CHAP domain-containing protein n=1 Tax=Rhizobium sp. CB3090 TaxID=3039156 RepID=UPI0024B0CA72|nr:CHAP domain-containing protein [Rhizobium sp. CB3090]WFU10896.1 CHAP domain-containing protein [Rhizobium sp. CB3090]